MIETVKQDRPCDHQLPGYGWTLKKLRRWVAEKLNRQVSRTTLRTLLKQAGLSWKKCKKVLAKANPEHRAEFVAHFQRWFEQIYQGQLRLIYVDEAHIHQDMALGYRWSVVGEADWVPSHCSPLKNRLDWYGAYDFSNGQCLIWHQQMCNSETTVAFLHHLAHQWPHQPNQQTAIIWDGASWHSRAEIVREAAEALGFILIQLPAYSPDLNPIEGLWKWMREALTQHHSYKYLYQLERACFDFIDRINLDPEAIITRLWPKFDLDPEYEKVLFSPRFQYRMGMPCRTKPSHLRMDGKYSFLYLVGIKVKSACTHRPILAHMDKLLSFVRWKDRHYCTKLVTYEQIPGHPNRLQVIGYW